MIQKEMSCQRKLTLNAQSQIGAKKVDWQIPSSTTNAGLVTDRRFIKGLRSIIPRTIYKENAEKRGARISDKCSRTFSSGGSPAHIHQRRNNKVNSLPGRQQDSIVLSDENGQNRQQCTGKDE